MSVPNTGAVGQPAGPAWLWGLIRGVRRDGVQPKDQRVRTLWRLLRSRGLLERDQWLKRGLRHMWQSGLQQRNRKEPTRRLKALLRAWGILPPRTVQGSIVVDQRFTRRGYVRPLRPLQPVRVRPVGQIRPIARPGSGGRRWR